MKVSIFLLVLFILSFLSPMNFKHKIIQWNCRGLKPKFDEISIILEQQKPSIFCLQETFLKPNDNVTLKGFNIYNYIHSDCQRPSGGSSILVKSSCPQRNIVLTTELQATAVSVTLDKEITICSIYSLSVLKSLDHTSSKNPQIQKLLEKHHELSELNEKVYCWIPSHIGIAGNKSVDQKAKDSLNLHPTNFSIPYANFKSFINRYILNKWQILWNNSVGNKLFEIKPVIGQSQPVVRNVRQEEVVLARLRIGHTRITHSYLLKREEPPYCFGCDTLFTVRHFLLECGDFSHIRNKYIHVDTIKQLFNDVPIDNIFLFLKEINLFNKL